MKKYFSGAASLYTRTKIKIRDAEFKYIKTNVSVPSIPVGKQALCFFPDRLFILSEGVVAAIDYSTLKISAQNMRFVEEDETPEDGTIVDYAWQYENKNGGPDRRFSNNRQFPVYLYSEIRFTSSTGLNELIQISQKDVGQIFNAEFNRYLASGVFETGKLETGNAEESISNIMDDTKIPDINVKG